MKDAPSENEIRNFGVMYGATIKILMQMPNGLTEWLRSTKILRYNHGMISTLRNWSMR